MFRGRVIPVSLLILLIVGSLSFLAIRRILSREQTKITATVLVEDGKTGRSLIGLPVEVDGTLAQTGEDGRAVFTELYPGQHTFKVSLTGFKDFFQTIALGRGGGEEVVFSLDLVTSRVKGRVLDKTAKVPVDGATVLAGGVTAKTGSAGRFALDEVIVGTPALRITKDGYKERSIKITLIGGITKNLGDLFLAPSSD